jgi:AcrR family transcriptional regulator
VLSHVRSADDLAGDLEKRMLLGMEANDRFSTIRAEYLQPGERRAQIVSAATTLFWQKGYHGASMRDIGERVGMLKGSLYAHVSNKEEILLEIVSTTFRRLMDALSPLLAETDPCEERLRRAFLTHATIVLEDPAATFLFFHEARHLDGEPGTWIRDAQQRYQTVWERLLQAGVDSGAFRADLDVQAAAVIALSFGDWAARVPPGTSSSSLTLAERFGTVLLEGCLA